MSTTMTYPVHVNADLDPGLSRWLWIFKWLLAIPHYVVLAFLWLAFAVLSVVAFFAILFTGRYPRSIFDFNVGVLRWSWRVAYYAFGALGTDRYPPFSLHDVPDYPAHLEIDYPQHLSRGLVLVKWWLLAIPQYIVVALLVGGTGYAVHGGTEHPATWGTGLIGILVLVAAVILLFTGRYPQQLFDLVLGLNRWVLRVAGYVSLMTDVYPPFGLDQGGHEDGGRSAALVIDPPTSPHGTPSPPRTGGWTTGRVVSLVVGAVLALVALGTGIAGVGAAAVSLTARDDAGFLTTPARTLGTPTYAIASTSLVVHADGPHDFMPRALLGDARLSARPANGDDVFIGIAPTTQVRSYLAGVQHATLVDWANDHPVLRTTDGSAPASPPAQMHFWTEQSSGPGRQQITWPVEGGDWTVLVMNADGSPGVSVAMTAGAEVPALGWLVTLLLVIAGLTLIAAIVLITVPVLAAGRDVPSS